MKLPLVRMGNSRGVRIPKALIELCDLGEEVEVEVSNGQLILHKASGNRAGWADAFARVGSTGGPEADSPTPERDGANVSPAFSSAPSDHR